MSIEFNSYDDSDEEQEHINKFSYLFKPIILKSFNSSLYFSEDDLKKIKEKNENLLEGKKKEFKISDKGVYSITKPLDALWIMDCIKKIIPNIKNLTITDSTAGLGGNTISFAKEFKKVNGIEINEVHFNLLKNNVEILDFDNVELHNANYMEKYNELKEDVVFIDPPWGGKKYHYIKYFNVRLGKVPISVLINLLYQKGVEYVVLKCPYNTNVTDILRYVGYNNCSIFKSSHIWLLIFSN